MERRAAAKRRGDRHADQAIKIMMNALFGVLGAAACRFFDPAIANAITGFGQQTLHWTREAFEAEGVEVLYGDTDSVFVQLRGAGEAARAEALRLRAAVEAQVAQRLREPIGPSRACTSSSSASTRASSCRACAAAPAARRSATPGCATARSSWSGLEAVRRDWPAVARTLQRGLLERVFADQDPLPFAREIALRVRAGELDAELVVAKRVRKGSVEAYTATTPPHVQAARKAGAGPGALVRYVVTATGPEPVRRASRCRVRSTTHTTSSACCARSPSRSSSRSARASTRRWAPRASSCCCEAAASPCGLTARAAGR